MTEELQVIADEIAGRADKFLAGERDRARARAGIAELLTMDYPSLDPASRALVTAGVIGILEEEDFFGIEFVGDPFADDCESEDG